MSGERRNRVDELNLGGMPVRVVVTEAMQDNTLLFVPDMETLLDAMLRTPPRFEKKDGAYVLTWGTVDKPN